MTPEPTIAVSTWADARLLGSMTLGRSAAQLVGAALRAAGEAIHGITDDGIEVCTGYLRDRGEAIFLRRGDTSIGLYGAERAALARALAWLESGAS
jgi:hypothetical protein